MPEPLLGMWAAVGSKPLSWPRVWCPVGGWLGGPAECPSTHSPAGAGSLATILWNRREQRGAPQGVAVALELKDVNTAESSVVGAGGGGQF